MIHPRKISAFFMALFAALFLVCGAAVAADKTLTAGSVSGDVGATVSLPITINDPTGVGGIAFTVNYAPTIFEFKGLEQAGKVITDPDANKDGVPDAAYTTDEIKSNLFYQVNEEKLSGTATGRLAIAAATAQALTGTNLALFKIKFLIKGGSGAYPINVVRTIVMNPAAGYSTPTYLPVFVGTTTPNTQGQYTDTNFPVYAATLVPGSITINAPKYAISGSVIYEGGSPANGSLVVLKRSTSIGYVFDAETTVSSGVYTFANKPAGTYQVFVTSNDPTYHNNQSAPFTVTNANVTVPQITLPAPQRLTGSVTVNGVPLAGLQIKVMSGTTVIGVYPVNPDGSFQTPPLPPGTYTLFAVYGSLQLGSITAGEANNLTAVLGSIGGNITGLTGAQTVTVMASSVAGKLQKATTVTTVDGSASYNIANLVPTNDYIVSVAGVGVPVTYYNGKTDVTQADYVDALANRTDVNFNFAGVTKGTIGGTITENQGPVPNIGVYASEANTFAFTQVQANGSGVYSFTLSPGTYEIFVIKKNIETNTVKIFYYKDGGTTQSQSEATKLVLAAGENLTGKNIDITECTNVLNGKVTYERADGNPAANVLITAVSNVGKAITMTRQDGAYNLSGLCAGTYRVEMNPLDDKYAVQSATVDVPATTVLPFIIDTGNVLSGKITDSADGTTPVSSAMIYLLDQQTGTLVNGRMYFSNNTGDYVIADIADGIYTMNVKHPLYRAHSESDLSITADMTKNIQLVKGAYFDVTVRDGDNANAPLPGALVIVTRMGDLPVYALTDANGNCKIYGLDATKSDYIILAQKPGFERESQLGLTPLSTGQAVEFILNRPAALFSLSGTIISGCAGTPPAAGAYVLVSTTARNFFASTTTDANGQYSFTNLPQASDYRFVVVPVGALRTKVETGLNFTGSTSFTKDVPIPCGSTISGTITRTGTAEIYVFLYTASNKFVAFTVADGSGGYTFTGLTDATTYKVLAVSSGNNPKWYLNQNTIDAATAVSAGASGINITLTP